MRPEKNFQTKMDKSKNIVSVTLEDSYTRTYPYGTWQVM